MKMCEESTAREEGGKKETAYTAAVELGWKHARMRKRIERWRCWNHSLSCFFRLPWKVI